MSIKVMSAVWELDLLPQDKFILLAMADHADDTGFCYPSLYRIAWKCGVSKDSIRRCLARMAFNGIVVVLQKGTGRGHTTRYQIRTQKGSKLQPFVSERVAGETQRVANGDIKGSTLCARESSLEPSLTVIEAKPESEKLLLRKNREEKEKQDAVRRGQREAEQRKKRWV